MPRGRPKGSKNKPKPLLNQEQQEKKPLENEIIIARQNALRRKREGKEPQVVNLIKDYEAENVGPPRGSPTGHCTHCGCEFEQEFSRERNAWSSYKICPDCKKKKSDAISKKTTKRTNEKGEQEEVHVATLPYNPYPWQIEAEEAFWNHRYTVLACGNRSGYYAPCIG